MLKTYLRRMPARRKTPQPTKLIQDWPLATAATFGSSVRARGILLNVRAGLSLSAKKLVDVASGTLELRVPDGSDDDFRDIIAIVLRILEGIEDLPVIPREVEDILTITSVERHRWLKDGRLQSGGTRTVKLRGRARKITFHVFDPRFIEDILDRGMPDVWREEDAIAAAENRRRAAGKAALTRAGKGQQKAGSAAVGEKDSLRQRLKGWDKFDLDGLLR